jgi:hypothetical protein
MDGCSIFADERPHLKCEDAEVAVHVEAIASVPGACDISEVCVVQLSERRPGLANHLRSVLSHQTVLWHVLCPQSHCEERDSSICARVELRKRVVAFEQVDDILCICFTSYCHVRVVGAASDPARHECAHDGRIAVGRV